jgi:hypothetical protein
VGPLGCGEFLRLDKRILLQHIPIPNGEFGTVVIKNQFYSIYAKFAVLFNTED